MLCPDLLAFSNLGDFFFVRGVMDCGGKKKPAVSVVVPPLSVWVPSQNTLDPSVTSVGL